MDSSTLLYRANLMHQGGRRSLHLVNVGRHRVIMGYVSLFSDAMLQGSPYAAFLALGINSTDGYSGDARGRRVIFRFLGSGETPTHPRLPLMGGPLNVRCMAASLMSPNAGRNVVSSGFRTHQEVCHIPRQLHLLKSIHTHNVLVTLFLGASRWLSGLPAWLICHVLSYRRGLQTTSR